MIGISRLIFIRYHKYNYGCDFGNYRGVDANE
jgi:hypothetical protein